MDRGVEKKAAVPKRDEKPIQGLVSDKNFIVANAVENILAGKWDFKKILMNQPLHLFYCTSAAPKLPGNKDKDYLKKKTYGKTPKYLTNIKNEIEDEYNLVREM